MSFFHFMRESFQFEMENLLQIVLVTLAWLLLALPLVTLPAATVAVYYFARQAWLNDQASLRDFAQGLRKYVWKSWVIVVPYVLILFVLIYSTAFYLAQEQPAVRLWASVPMAAFSLLMLIQSYAFVFFVKEDGVLWLAVKRAFLLAASHLLFSMGLMLLTLLYFLGLYATRIGLAMLFVGPVAVLQTSAVRHLLATYKIEP